MNRAHKVAQFASREIEKSADRVFLQVGATVIAFGRYVITRDGADYLVQNSTKIRRFGSSQSATSWCVADRYQDFVLAQRILQLDEHRSRLRADIGARSRVAERSRSDVLQDRVAAKLQSRSSFLAGVDRELDKCIDRAKYLQNQGFEHETARSRRN